LGRISFLITCEAIVPTFAKKKRRRAEVFGVAARF